MNLHSSKHCQCSLMPGHFVPTLRASLLVFAGSSASSRQHYRGYSAVPRPPPPPLNIKPGTPRTPPQNPDPWAELEGQSRPGPSQPNTQAASDAQRGQPQASDPWAELEGSTGQSTPAPSSSAAGSSQRQGSYPSSSQRQPPPGQGSSAQLGRPLGRAQGSSQQQGGPSGERDPWAELEGQASRPPTSRGPPPGGFQGGFSGGFQGRSRELVNLKQRQVMTSVSRPSICARTQCMAAFST